MMKNTKSINKLMAKVNDMKKWSKEDLARYNKKVFIEAELEKERLAKANKKVE